MHRAIALITVAAMVTGCGARWPQVTSLESPELRAGATPLYTIDVLPVDLEVWNDARAYVDLDEARKDVESRIIGTVTEVFYRRGYAIGAVLDWNGNHTGANGETIEALTPPEVLATVDSLASYGAAVTESGELPAPYLPVRLGTKTGSDATLYVGGWGFVGVEHETAKTIGKVVVFAILIVGVIAVMAAVSKSGDKVLDKVGSGASTVGRAAVSVGRSALRAGSAVVQVGGEAVRVIDDILTVADAFGRTATHISIASQRPVWSKDRTLPRKGSPRMYLEMTLVDNRTGAVLWHAHQRFPANPLKPGDVTRAARSMLATLPAAAGTVPMVRESVPVQAAL